MVQDDPLCFLSVSFLILNGLHDNCVVDMIPLTFSSHYSPDFPTFSFFFVPIKHELGKD